MSKGDKVRPMTVTYNEYVDNWDKAFGKEVCIICGGDEDIRDMTMDQVYRTGGMYNGLACKKCRKVVDNKHIPNEWTLKSMEKTEKGEGLTLLNDNSLEYQLERMKTSHA